MDKIIMKDLHFFGYHGLLPEETRLGQRFIIDLELYVDMKKAGDTDDLNYSVSYADVFEDVRELAEGDPFKLIEALAENIASVILGKYSLIKGLQVTVKKPEAPVNGIFDYFAVEIIRMRG